MNKRVRVREIEREPKEIHMHDVTWQEQGSMNIIVIDISSLL